MQLGTHMYPVAARFFRIVRWYCQYQLQGQDNLRIGESFGPIIVVANHTSTWDSFIISSLVGTRISWVTDIGIHQSDYFVSKLSRTDWWLPGWAKKTISEVAAYIIRNCDTIPIDRNARPFNSCQLNSEGIRKAIRNLNAGKAVGVFPEGGVTQKLHKPSLYIPTLLMRDVESVRGVLQIYISHKNRTITVFPLEERSGLINSKCYLNRDKKNRMISRLHGK